MAEPVRVLYFENNPDDAKRFQQYLKECPVDYHVDIVRRLSEGLDRHPHETLDVILVDIGLPDAQGIDTLKRIISHFPEAPIIVLSKLVDEKLAVLAVKEGAQDYLIKDDINPRVLSRVISYAIERKRYQQSIHHLNRLFRSIQRVDHLIIREKNEDALLQSVTDILRTVGGFYIVWIGLIDESTSRVIPAAASGIDMAFLREQTITLDDSATGRGPSGTAFRKKKTCVFSNCDDEQFARWSDEIKRFSITSCVASPLMIDDSVLGILNVFSRGPNSFDNDEVTLIEETAGDLAFAICAIRTEREKIRFEEVLRQSEEKFQSLFMSSRDVVYMSTAAGRFIDINPAGEETFGYTRQELLTIDIKSLYKNPEERERYKKAVAGRGFVKDHEVAMQKKDGTVIDCLITSSVLTDARGAILGYQGIIRDVTEQKRLQRQIIQTEKLSSLGEIISGVAHELNNPLTSIIGNAQLLIRKDIPQDCKRKLDVIKNESIRCTKIVGGLLSFAREHKPERRDVNINEIVMEACRLREYDLTVNNVKIIIDLSDGMPTTFADPYQLQQVFMNLINNAHDAISENKGGTLTIRSSYREGFITVSFSDDGPGILPSDLNRIFDPFFTTKDVGKGTGMGLAVSYGIIREHGGTIDVESRPRMGTVFTVTIPVQTETEPLIGDLDTSSSKKPTKKKGILIVEDEEALRSVIMEALTDEGYYVKGASNGQQAVNLLKILQFDLIITDLKMPGIGGKELYTYILKNVPKLANRVVFITGDVLGKDTQSFLKITGNPYIEKPFDPDRLLRTVKIALDRDERDP